MHDFYYWKRELLYAEVWEQPATKVAEKFGVSDVAIGKLCRRLKVPIPGRGYWARKAAGQRVTKPPLPKFDNPPVIVYRKHVRHPKPQIDSPDPELAKIAEVERTEILRPNLEHKLVERARQVLQRARTDEYERSSRPSSSACLDIKVSQELLDRALSVMNALVVALESGGLKVLVGKEFTTVEVFGQTMKFGIEEDLQIKERREVKSYSGTKSVNVYERSGNLAFRVLNPANGSRAHWGDSKTWRLEELLPKCIGGIYRHARLLRIEEEEIKQRKLRWERERQEAEERQRKAREEQERLQNLEKCISNWTKAQQIRAFVEAYEKMSTEKGESMAADAPRGRWIAWARRKADEIDPLVEAS